MLPRRVRVAICGWHDSGVKEKEIVRRVSIEMRKEIGRKRIRSVIAKHVQPLKGYCIRGLPRDKWEAVKRSVKEFYLGDKRASPRRVLEHVEVEVGVKVSAHPVKLSLLKMNVQCYEVRAYRIR